MSHLRIAFVIESVVLLSLAGMPLFTTALAQTPAETSNAGREPTQLDPPILREPIRTGAQTVEGWVPGWSAERDKESKKVVVSVYRALSLDAQCTIAGARPDAAASPCGALNVRATPFDQPQSGVVYFGSVTPGEDGSFRAALSERLLPGQRVLAVVDGGEGTSPSAPVAAIVEDPGDWGRVRAYFAGGVVIAHDRGGFSEQDFALGFAMDTAWVLATPPRVLEESDERRCNKTFPTGRRDLPRDNPCRTRRSGLGFKQLNNFIDVRLTTIPVVGEAGNEEAGDGGGSGATDNLGAFVSAQKAAVIQAGVYAPIYGRLTMWTYRNEPNALFLAPVFRAGIQTITERAPATAATETGVAAGGAGAAAAPDAASPDSGGDDVDDVFSFWSAGIGIGHYRVSDSKHRAPELISYLHLTFGQFETFKRAGESTRSMRVALEGRLKIPETPMQIGLDANLGEGPDSVSFVFATRFDLGELFAKLKQF